MNTTTQQTPDLNTLYLSVSHAAELILSKGVRECLAAIADNISASRFLGIVPSMQI